MQLKELSAEYRRTGERCRATLREQRRLLSRPGLPEGERIVLHRRVTLLTAMTREAIATAIYLDNYYGRDRP